MLRECTMNDISDGRLYDYNDMVKADTMGCKNCYKCCTGMGNSIVLDPYDVWRIKYGLNKSFQELLNNELIELNLVDGLILPNLKMGESDRCSFLNSEGRCSIHSVRPGLCRIFPLGRVYENEDFKYFLQKNQCSMSVQAKIKVKKWIDVANINENHKFINTWHAFIRKTGDINIKLKNLGKGERINDIAMYVLNTFFVSDLLTQEEKEMLDEKKIFIVVEEKIEKAIVDIGSIEL